MFDTHADSESSSLLAQLVERTAVNRDVIGSIPMEGEQAPLAQLVRALYLYRHGIHSGFSVTMVQIVKQCKGRRFKPAMEQKKGYHARVV